MTHDEIKDLLAGYAINALTSDEARSVAAHLGTCDECVAELLSLSEAVDALAGAVPRLMAPEHVRSRVLADTTTVSTAIPGLEMEPARVDSQPPRFPPVSFWKGSNLRPSSWAFAAAVVVLALLSAATLNVLNTNRQMHQELAESRAALSLLTSTETANDVLTRASDSLPLDAHGHWFHRSGVMTQVVVGERLPSPSPGERYLVWMEGDRSWMLAGHLNIDDAGYGRLVILGADGADYRSVEITLEADSTSAPGPSVMLKSAATSQ